MLLVVLKLCVAPNASPAILMAIGRARRWMGELINGSRSLEEIAAREEMGERNVRRLLPLACRSPNIVRAIAGGSTPANDRQQPDRSTPHDWAAQERRFLTLRPFSPGLPGLPLEPVCGPVRTDLSPRENDAPGN